MNNISPSRIVTVGLLGAIAVSLGALGAHALKMQLTHGTITVDQLNGFDTGVKYQMYHTLAMLLVAILQSQYKSKYYGYAYALFFTGIVLFSGSLYLLCTRGITGMESLKILGPITPIGGVAFVLGWLCLVLAAFKKS